MMASAADIEAEENEVRPMPKFGLYNWFVLGLIVMVRVMMQSQRAFLSFAYGFTGTGA